MAKRHCYLFIYDIGNPNRQAQIRHHLRAYATGGQKSLYECWLTPKERQQLCLTLHKLLQTNDKLHYFHLPAHQQNHLLLGIAQPLRYDYFIIA